MNITVKYTGEGFVNVMYALRWRMYRKQALKPILIFSVSGILLTIICFATYNDYSISQMPENTYYFNLHIMESIGISILIVTLFLFRSIFKIKKQFFKDSRLTIARFGKSNEVVLNISEDALSYSSKYLTQKIAWLFWDNFSETEDHILLTFEKNPFTAIPIDKRKLTNEEHQLLIDFLKNRRKINYQILPSSKL